MICLRLYREKYFDFNVRHFHEKLVEEHGSQLSYTWVKMALQGAGGWWASNDAGGSIGADGRGCRCLECCCTSMPANMPGLEMGGTTT